MLLTIFNSFLFIFHYKNVNLILKITDQYKNLKVLICNDDGYQNENIKLLYHVAYELFKEVVIVAPMYHQSGASTKISIGAQMRYEKYEYKLEKSFLEKNIQNRVIDDHLEGYIIDGSPADCCRFGIHMFNPDLVLSGLNNGSNVGCDQIYSGTIGVCRNACVQHIPSIAFSNARIRDLFKDSYPRLRKSLIQIFQIFNYQFLQDLLQKQLILNINFPAGCPQKIVYADCEKQLVFDFQIIMNNKDNSYRYTGFGGALSNEKCNKESDWYQVSQNNNITYTFLPLYQKPINIFNQEFEVVQNQEIN